MYVGTKAKARVNTTVSCRLSLSVNKRPHMPAARPIEAIWLVFFDNDFT
jgi:hypothetical protein